MTTGKSTASDATAIPPPYPEFRDRDELAEWQDARLRETVAHLEQSSYWSGRFAEAGVDVSAIKTADDLYGFPTLTKQDYIAALEASPEDYGGLLCCQRYEIPGANVYHTTGTSGMPGRFINSDEGSAIYGRQGAVLLQEAGARPGDVVMLTFPLSLWAAGWGLYYGAKQSGVVVLPAGAPVTTAQRIQLLREYRPAVVAATPSYALTLGTALAEAGVDPEETGVRGLLLGGETFSPSRRKRIEDLWGAPGGTRTFFGISEGGPLFAVECAAQDGMHLFEQYTIHQFWKPDAAEPANEGELAEHVFTSVSQRTMATWFNFRTRDGAVYSDDPCSCGKITRRMWIKERLDDMVKVRGVNIFASTVEQVLSTVPGTGPEFRLVVERHNERDLLTVEVERTADVTQDVIAARAAEALKTAIGVRIDVSVLDPDTLPKTELKARRWLDLRPRD